MSDDVLRDRELPGSESTVGSQGVRTAPTQLLTGLTVGLPTNRVVCIGCRMQLTEGQAVTVYSYRRAECLEWNLRQCYCMDCAPTTINEPTLGVTELLARAWLGTVARPRTRTHRLCLLEIEVVAYSPPEEGARP